MNPQTRRLIMWNEHAERWEPIGAAAPQPRKPKRRLGFIFTANLQPKTTTVQIDASAYTEEGQAMSDEVSQIFAEAQQLQSDEHPKRDMVGTCDNCNDLTHTQDVGSGRRLCYRCREDTCQTEPWERLARMKEDATEEEE